MPASLRFSVVLVASFILWVPALWSHLHGDLDAGAVGVRCAGALALSTTVVTLFGGLLRGYAQGPAGPTRLDDPEIEAAAGWMRRAGNGGSDIPP